MANKDKSKQPQPPSQDSVTETTQSPLDQPFDDELASLLDGLQSPFPDEPTGVHPIEVDGLGGGAAEMSMVDEVVDLDAIDSAQVVGEDPAPLPPANEPAYSDDLVAAAVDAAPPAAPPPTPTNAPRGTGRLAPATAARAARGTGRLAPPIPEAPPAVEPPAPVEPPPPPAVEAAPPPKVEAAPPARAAARPAAKPVAAPPAHSDEAVVDVEDEEPPPPVETRARPAARPTPAAKKPVKPGQEFLVDNGVFRREVQKLARARKWTEMAEMTSAAVENAEWASLPETRAALLVDLAKVYRDRLGDAEGAEKTFRRLADVDPSNDEAVTYLSDTYRERGEWRLLYDLYSAAIEPSWDPEQRLAWTREMVEIADNNLHQPEMAIGAWERLWKLGDAVDETVSALSEVYRRARRWDGLASFLGQRAQQVQGAERVVALREVAEAYLSGLRDQDKARGVLDQILADRPGDLVALMARARMFAGKRDWDALADLSAQGLADAPRAAQLDFRRLVADALWSGGELERAVTAYERLLELDPDDADAVKAREDYLAKVGKYDVLVNVLADRATRAATDDERAKLLARAATMAEKELDDPRLAISLWERRAQIEQGRIEAFQALANLYESLGDLQGVARALEGQLALTRNTGARVELLRRYGEHAAHRMGDDARAEQCWKEIVALHPDDRATQEELIALHRRRGDFEALDRALAQQAWRALDDDAILTLWRGAAENCDANIADARRAIAAWLRVLDLQPEDPAARNALVNHYRSLGNQRDLIVALEALMRITSDDAARSAIALEVARLWEQQGANSAAISTYERVLRWNPADQAALDALSRLRTGADAGAAVGALEVAASTTYGGARLGLLHKAVSGDGDAIGKFHGLRRVLWLSGGAQESLAEVVDAAGKAGSWTALASVYEELASSAEDPATRARYQRELAKIAEDKLKSPVRALLALEAVGRSNVADADVQKAIERLCEATGRHEDALAIADVAARAESPEDVRRAGLRRRLELCEKALQDGERAFLEAARLLHLDPADAQALADARRLAEATRLWRDLDALYAELWDRAPTGAQGVAQRVQIARERYAIHAQRLNDASGALDQLLVVYRLSPDEEGLLDKMMEAADALKAWDRVLPLVEARARAAGEASSPDELARIAALHEDKRGDRERAFELYAEALVLRPSSTELHDKLERLAEATQRWEQLAGCYRYAAARSSDALRKLDLYHRITAIHASKLGKPGDGLDIHHRILQLQPSALPSLEQVIDAHRNAGDHRELRDRLQQWTERTPPEADRVPKWLEIARLSRAELADPESALAAYAKVLEVQPSHEEAMAGIRSLTEGRIEPALELRRLRIELDRAEAARRVEIQLAMAKIQEQELDDVDGAVATLRALVKESGADGPGYEPLARLLKQRKESGALVDLMEARAQALPDAESRLEALAEAIKVSDESLPEPAAGAVPVDEETAARRERLFRRVLTEQPGDMESRRRLLSLYRETGRFDDMAQLVRAALEDVAVQRDTETRITLENELARVLDRGLGKLDEAEAVLQARLKRTPSDADVLVALASIRRRKDDFAGYLDLRQKQAKQLPPQQASLVLCHLAEACDETAGQQDKVAGLYREARTLDATNPSAIEALKAIGRRAKGWRASAALLPDPDESKLSWADRSDRLRQLGEKAADPTQAASFFQRAVAVDPDNYQAWDGLAKLATKAHDAEAAREAERSSLMAFERGTTPAPSRLAEHAERIYRLSLAHRATGDDAGAARLALRAHQLMPDLASASLAVADQRLEADDTEVAFALYDRVLRRRQAGLAASDLLHATFQRGALSARLDRADDAIRDLREALRLDALHAGALQALADVLSQKGRVGAAAQHYIQALLVVAEQDRRGQLYARLGRLWEDSFHHSDEAGVCYDLAAAAGVDDRELMVRALRHYRRSGQQQRALDVIEKLLPSMTEAADQAMLWTERGGILAQDDEQQAMEAYDMALSYDPGNRDAVAGLSELLERRGDWEQLIQLHEARTDSGTPDERAEALRSLAKIAMGHLKDTARTEKYLMQATALAPKREDFETLLSLYGDGAEHAANKRAALAGLLSLGGPWMPRLIELGKSLVTMGERRWGWCLLSPLMSATLPDPQLKSMVLELRKEFEKADHTTALTADTHAQVKHPAVDDALLGVLAELDGIVTLGYASLEELGATGVSKLDERTAVGKAFAALGQRLGIEGVQLLRAQELPVPYAIVDGDQAQVAVRAELLQLLSPAEQGFLFATLCELTRPGVRILASLGDARPHLAPALFAAVGLCPPAEGSEAIVERIREAAGPDRVKKWHDALAGGAGTPDERGERTWLGVLETARRVGLVAAADLRFVARLLTRLDESLPKMPTVGKVEDLETFFENATALQPLVGFAASPAFGKFVTE